MMRSGAQSVLALDLWRDLSTSYALDVPPLPPAVALVPGQGRFSRVHPVPDTTGDIREPLVISTVRRLSTTGCLMVVDIPLRSRSDVLGLLEALKTVRSESEILIRWIGRRELYAEVCATLLCSGSPLAGYSIYEEEGWVEAWIHATVSTSEVFRPVTSAQLSQTPTPVPPLGDYAQYEGGRLYLLQLMISPFDVVSPDSMEDIAYQTSLLVAQVVGLEEHRFSYSQWTRVLEACLVLNVLQEKNAAELCQVLAGLDGVSQEVAGRRTLISLRKSTKRLITRILPRLL